MVLILQETELFLDSIQMLREAKLELLRPWWRALRLGLKGEKESDV